MKSIAALIIAATVVLGLTGTMVEAAKPATHHASAKGQTYKKEFMYWKGGKCIDSRDSKA